MRIIIVEDKHGGGRTPALGGWARATLTVCLLGLPVLFGYFGYQLSSTRGLEAQDDEQVQAWAERHDRSQQAAQGTREEAREQLRLLARSLALLQTRLLHLGGFGTTAELADAAYAIDSASPLGGSPSKLSRETRALDEFLFALDALWQRGIGSPGNGQPGAELTTGSSGWRSAAATVSSPASAELRRQFRSGPEAVAGKGFKDYPSHHRPGIRSGDILKRGELIALSGSAGLFTAAPVHAKIHKHGRLVDPATYFRHTRH